MKLLNTAFCLMNVMNPIQLNEDANTNQYLKSETEAASVDTNINYISKNMVIMAHDQTGEETVKLQGNEGIPILLGKNQTEILNNSRVKNRKVVLTFEAKFRTLFVKDSAIFTLIFDDDMRDVTDKVLGSDTLKWENGADKKVRLKVEKYDLTYDFKNGQNAIVINPSIEFKYNDFENPFWNSKSYYDLSLKNITVTGSKNIYDFGNIKHIGRKILFKDRHNFVKNWILGDELNLYLKECYGLPIDFANKKKTLEIFKYDKLNTERPNTFEMTVVPNEKYLAKNNLIIKLVFDRIDREEKQPKNPKKVTDKNVLKSEIKDINNESELPLDNESNNEIKDSKNNTLKYLWLLLIPLGLGICTLISYFLPFRKRKSN